MTYTDIMLDLETSGLAAASTTGILQIGAIKFNYETEAICPQVFNRCLALPPGRFWDEGTREWWSMQNRAVFDSIIARMEDPEVVMRDLFEFGDGNLRFWAKPAHFDYPILTSYFNQFGLSTPFNYRNVRDLNTFMAARAGGVEHQPMEHLSAGSGAHDALNDCVYQLKMLFSAKHGVFNDGIEEAEYEPC